jgi:GntR family transcriptional regulator
LDPGTSICEQVVYAAKKAVVSGQLLPGDPFPSVRSLSRIAKINPNTAHKIIARLIAGGLLEVKPGTGTVVAAPASEHASARSDLLKSDLERVVVEAKRVGVTLDDLAAALAYHWTQLSRT